ncbi:MAG: hypothetical protein AAFQ94_22245 [Bacteroidota bacterium]
MGEKQLKKKRKRTGFSRSDLVSLGAIAISFAALGTGIIQANIMRNQQKIMDQQQKASVWPYVKAITNYEFNSVLKKNVINCSLENKGVGPAIVKNLELLFDGKTYNSYEAFLNDLDSGVFSNKSILNFKISKSERVLKPGEIQPVFSLSFDPEDFSMKDILSLNAQLQVCYCSVNNDCWRENGKEINEDYPCD